ncbi:alpha/beta hydrolase [Zunongwangia endophytica]|uniref:Alpha/beta hydrolase n=1 Tax=Zunongwangia endophytica TaxID=1808945 RepID=A0ABV8H7W0_9FLAO|nr:alpha/beta hydrolase-fold protein [Zunongwangia endophytica]MDN3595662.1 alpha/beta hydrolase-fold protein [Zunongwangia endophytica]
MIKNLLLAVVIIFPWMISAQTTYETVSSDKLGTSREIKIQLPRNYEANKEKLYPVMLVLDGDYLFEPVAGMIDFYSYWEDAPEMIVVGVNQNKSREADSYYDEERYLPSEEGAAFFEFLGMELMKSIAENYRVAPFHVIVGHDLTANFMNYYLLKDNPIFDAYINLSPDYAPKMTVRLNEVFQKTEKRIWYYLATGSDDIPQLQESIITFDGLLKDLNNTQIEYDFDNFENSTHYSLVGKAIPAAIDNIFEIYRPISQKEYQTKLLQTSISLSEYLEDKYSTINELFGLEKQIRLNDFLAINQAIEKTRRWDDFKGLSKLAADHYPNTMLATYFEARWEEETGNPQRAIKTYQKAYSQKPISFLTTDFMLERANEIKKANR